MTKRNKLILWGVVIFVALAGLGAIVGDDTPNKTAELASTKTSLKASDYKGKEGLVVFNDLVSKGYKVKAQYVNDKVPATNHDFTEQFKNADPNKCEDRLGYDAYVVSDVKQDGNNVQLILDNKPTASESCPTKNEAKTESVPAEYKSALAQAASYANMMHLSKQGVYDQLVSEYGGKFKPEAAQYAIDNVKADWNANALAQAKTYQNDMHLSPAAVRDQLISENGGKFTEAEADYAIQHLND